MNTALKRAVALLLSLLFVLPLLVALPVAAEQSSTRFIFSSLTASDNTVYSFQDGAVALSLSSASKSFRANALIPVESAANALYLSLVNQSSATTVTVTYTYEENAQSKTETVSAAILPGHSAPQSVTLPVKHFSKDCTALSLSFSGEGELSGIVELRSFFDLTTYVPETYLDHQGAPLATLSACKYDGETKSIEITGKISHATSATYPRENYYLALFSLSAGETLYLSRKTPLIRSEMALDFSFTVPVETTEDLYVRYVIAAVDRRQGASTPLCAPVYPSLVSASMTSETQFKGFHTTDLGITTDVTPGVSFVDVYLNRLQSEQSGGLLYVGEHAYYYFDEEYVGELDRRIRNLCGMGTHVYLRFLIDADANYVSFADYCDEEAGVINKMPTVRNEQAQRDLQALIDFLCRRYADDTVGHISGIVLGRAADRAKTHNFADTEDLSEYAALYATAMHLVATTARRNIPGLSVIVPVSDRVWNGSYDEDLESGEYYTALFLPAILRAFRALSLEHQPFGLMLESDQIPSRLSDAAGQGYGTDQLDLFFRLLDSEGEGHPYLSSSIFYAWAPDASCSDATLKAAYLLQYLTLYRSDRVQSFIVDTSKAEQQGKDGAVDAITFLARYVDTDKLESASAAALHTLGVTGIEELFSDLSSDALKTREVYTTSLTTQHYASGVHASGTYRMWDFQSATTALEWYAGAGCYELTVTNSSKDERALTGHLKGTDDRGGIAYHFTSPVDISFAPLLSFELAVQGGGNTRFEVQLRLIGDGDTVLASTILDAGDSQRLYLDLSGHADTLSRLRSIQLTARGLDGNTNDFTLSLYSFDWESDRLTTAELAQKVNAIRETQSSTETPELQRRDITLPLIATAILALASIAVVVLVLIRYTGKRRKTNHLEEG